MADTVSTYHLHRTDTIPREMLERMVDIGQNHFYVISKQNDVITKRAVAVAIEHADWQEIHKDDLADLKDKLRALVAEVEELKLQHRREITELKESQAKLQAQFDKVKQAADDHADLLLNCFQSSMLHPVRDMFNSASDFFMIFSTDVVRVFFTVVVDTRIGQDIFITGNHVNLGEWREDNAVAMRYEANGRWVVQAFMPRNTRVEFKYLLRENGSFKWQPGPNNRLFLNDNIKTSFSYWVCCSERRDGNRLMFSFSSYDTVSWALALVL